MGNASGRENGGFSGGDGGGDGGGGGGGDALGRSNGARESHAQTERVPSADLMVNSPPQSPRHLSSPLLFTPQVTPSISWDPYMYTYSHMGIYVFLYAHKCTGVKWWCIIVCMRHMQNKYSICYYIRTCIDYYIMVYLVLPLLCVI